MRRKFSKPRQRSYLLRPSQEQRSLAFQMRLSGSYERLKLYCETVETIAKLGDQYPDLIRPMCIDSSNWMRFVQIAGSRRPLIANYEEAWPVAAILSAHRHAVQRSGGKGSGLINWTRYMAPEKLMKLVPELKRAIQGSTAAPILDPDSRDSKSQANVHVPAPTVLDAIASPTPGPTLETSASISTQTYRLVTYRTSTLPPVDEGGTEPVLAFLRQLKPEQSHLLPLFVAMGVNDRAALQSLAQMETRDAWLYSWVKENHITELQFAIIMAGVRKMPCGGDLDTR